MICSVVLALLAACGGGGDFDDVEAAAEVPQADGRATALSAASGADLVANTDGAPLMPAMPSIAETIGTERTLSPTASVWLAGIPESPPPAPALPDPPIGSRTFYVDSQLGNDQYNGRAASRDLASSGSAGPWRTLARVMRSKLGPGDRLVLACGSTWRETLRVPKDGTATKPVVVTAPPEGCGSTPKPTIDGSVSIPPGDWTHVSGSIWRTTLSATPLQLFAPGGVMVEAHHPNRGHDAARPRSVFLPMAGNGGTKVVNGLARGTSVITGPELSLPAGATLRAGARVRIRTNSWTIEERALSAVALGSLTLAMHTYYPAVKDFGYFLLGEAWMVDSQNEWHFDAGTRRLLAWMPDGKAPSAPMAVSTLATGADLTSRSHVLLQGLAIRRVGQGLALGRSTGVQVRGLVVEDTATIGADVAGSTGATIDFSLFNRAGQDAISGIGSSAAATRMAVRQNLIRDSGVLTIGETAVGLPTGSFAAIYAGPDATVTGNVIVNSGYIGIRFMERSLVADNLVFGACAVLDDCAGIYTWGAGNSNSMVRSNVIVRAIGGLEGKPANSGSQGQGLYLDLNTAGVTLLDNTVIDTEDGIHIHNAAGNVVRGNRLYGSRRSAIWLQNDPNLARGDMQVNGNVVEGNLIAPATPTAFGLLLDTRAASTASFGSFSGNRYLDRLQPTVVMERTSNGWKSFSLAAWQQSSGVGSAQRVDADGAGVSQSPYAALRIDGSNVVPNGSASSDAAGWTHYNATLPRGRLLRESCSLGSCLRYVPGGSSGLFSSPNFTVTQGQWYRLSLDIATDQDNQPVNLVVRRGGGGGNGYESLSDRPLAFTGQRGWERHNVVFQATKTVRDLDATTGDLGARVDIEGLTAGRSVVIANLEVVPVTVEMPSLVSGVVVNASREPRELACPASTTAAGQCSELWHLADHAPLTWPLRLPAGGSAIVFAQNLDLADDDLDGIANAGDECPATATGRAVNAAGCPLNLP